MLFPQAWFKTKNNPKTTLKQSGALKQPSKKEAVSLAGAECSYQFHFLFQLQPIYLTQQDHPLAGV